MYHSNTMNKLNLTHGSLFSGIGGFDLAAEWAGWSNLFHCEWNSFGQKILKYYWPNSVSYGDIKQTDFTIWRGRIDVLSGGFPCQPYSIAGKRKGNEDERHLWPEMLRAIREITPGWVVGENVRGLTNWNGGLVFHEVQSDLEAAGYEVLPFLLPASGVNAPHERYRIWFIAKNTISNGRLQREFEQEGSDFRKQWNASTGSSNRIYLQEGNFTDSERERQQGPWRSERQVRSKTPRDWKASWSYDDGRWPTQSPICSRNDGLPSKLDGTTFSIWRQESIKSYGNAIVPQEAYQIFKAINTYTNKYLIV